MRKYFLSTSGIFLAGLLFFTGCQKEITESPIDNSGDAAASGNLANKDQENSCRLVTFDWPTGAVWQFHYNDKGLADQWIMDFGFGFVIEETMYYDENNRLIRAEEDFFGAGSYIYHFYYSGKRLTRLTRTNVDFPEDALDFTYTYNAKGQNTRQDDNIHDQHVLMYYDAIGNGTRTDLYFGSDLIFSDIYTYNIPARNPRLHIPGVETGFPFYGTGGLTDKWWFSSNKTITYENGNPILINDYDPSQTIINTGDHNLPGTANYYDWVTESTINMSFEYENCAGEPGGTQNRTRQANKRVGNNTISGYNPPLLVRGSSKSVKEQLQKLTEQNKK